MRTTQYIGLNQYALDYLATQKVIKTEEREIDVGIGGEPVFGTIYHVEQDYPEVNEQMVLIEEVQANPWSSGPMFFTCLRAELVKKYDGQKVDLGRWFEWMVDPSVEEYCRDTGRYYV